MNIRLLSPERPPAAGWIAALLALAVAWGPAAAGQEREGDDAARRVELADGRVVLTAPDEWTREQPRTRIVEAEFSLPAADDDPVAGRLTLMGAGGTVQQNIDRWIGQFVQPDGSQTRQRARIEETEIAGQPVHLVDLSGTYRDQPGPFAPAVLREDYRMLAAIIVTENLGQYFVRLYGPAATVSEHEKAFREFLETLEVR